MTQMMLYNPKTCAKSWHSMANSILENWVKMSTKQLCIGARLNITRVSLHLLLLSNEPSLLCMCFQKHFINSRLL